MRSLRERYKPHTLSHSAKHDHFFPGSAELELLDPAVLAQQEELELLVRDFTIDDSISDCFADSEVGLATVIGVDCKPSSKVSDWCGL